MSDLINSDLTWHGDTVIVQIQATSFENVKRCAAFLAARLKEVFNVRNPAPYKTPSAPGEPPRKRTGRLQGSVAYTFNEAAGSASVGVSAEYGPFLEKGTRYMDARPFVLVLVTVRAHLAELGRIAGGV